MVFVIISVIAGFPIFTSLSGVFRDVFQMQTVKMNDQFSGKSSDDCGALGEYEAVFNFFDRPFVY